MRAHLRLVYSSGEAPVSAQEKERVYPPAITCFQCRSRFTTDDEVKAVVENDGACPACAEKMDDYPLRSSQGNPDNSSHEWNGGK